MNIVEFECPTCGRIDYYEKNISGRRNMYCPHCNGCRDFIMLADKDTNTKALKGSILEFTETSDKVEDRK